MRVTDLRHSPPLPEGTLTPLLLTSATGNIVTIGPLYVQTLGVCPDCVRHWANIAGWDRPVAPEPTSKTIEMLASMVAEVASQLQCGAPMDPWLQTIFEIEVDTGLRRQHSVFPRADCPRCCSLSREQLALSVHCSPLTGIVSSVTVTPEPFAGSYSASGRFVAPLPVRKSRPLLRAQNALGKGHTRQQAIDSCIGEALERYSLIYTGAERLVRARLNDLPAIDPREILLVSDRQYETRESWNASHDDRYWIPERFDPAAPLDFLAGLDLAANQTVYVPAACCLMWYRFGPGERRFASADSIGCGAGRTLASATASALLEWVERDSLAIWWYNRVRRPAVVIESFDSSYLNRIRDALQSARRDLFLIDITTDLAIPTYVAVSPARGGTEPLFASAAHPEPREAALKAASEVAQLIFSTVQTGAIEPEIHAWLNLATMENQPFLAPIGFAQAPPEPNALSAEEAVKLCVERMTASGLRPIAIDHSRPDVLLKTVRAVAPGMRHIWARFAAGRLFDVPVRMGWRSEPLTEEALNSILCMI